MSDKPPTKYLLTRALTAGIGTYVTSGSLSQTSVRARLNSWYTKAKDSAVGSSFDQHVVGGYRFLMRFYNTGDEIYMFGFSRGAYIARFLAEMLDYIGLLSHGNEEMVKFAWKAFAQWQCRQQSTGADAEAADAQQRKMFNFMKGFRETFSRPVGRIQFLGLFDTVNSVPRFETAWMQRSKFPYTARSSARVIRHAVSIDERRAKFRQDLMYQDNPKARKHHRHHHRHHHIGDWKGWEYFNMYNNASPDKTKTEGQTEKQLGPAEDETAVPGSDPASRRPQVPPGKTQQSDTAPPPEPKPFEDRGRRRMSTFLSPRVENQRGKPRRASEAQIQMASAPQDRDDLAQRRATQAEFTPYRARSASRRRPMSQQQQAQEELRAPSDVMSDGCGTAPSDIDPDWDDDVQDIDEVWFSGGHADVGGGWEMLQDSKSASHVPLAWIVREAMRAGLSFDPDKVAEMGCACGAEWDGLNPAKRPVELKRQQRQQKKQRKGAGQNAPNNRPGIPDIRMANGGHPHFAESPPRTQDDDDVSPTRKIFSSSSSTTSSSDSDSDDEDECRFHGLMSSAHTARIHDSLAYGGGLGAIAVSAWKFMEYLPFRRMDLKGDGSWEPIRWPLPRGEVRDIPDNVRVHGSVIRRMKEDRNYRPGNLIIGGGGRGVRRAPPEHGIGDWICSAESGDPIGEIWVRKKNPDNMNGGN